MSTAGETGAIVVDNDTLSRLNESARIRSIRDKNFDAARDALSAWLSVTPEVPDWLRKKTATIGQWKSPKRLAALAIEWRGRRFDDDASGYEPVEAWRYNDHHLWAWETTAKPIRRRRELYRLAAAALGKRFGSLVMDDTNLSALARRPSVESDGDAKQAHRNRVLAAPYALKEALRNVYGKSLVVVPAEGLSHTCPDCGSSDAAQRDKAKRWVACVRCTFSRDEDTTALMNTLARAGFAREVADMIKRGHEFAAALKGGQ